MFVYVCSVLSVNTKEEAQYEMVVYKIALDCSTEDSLISAIADSVICDEHCFFVVMLL